MTDDNKADLVARRALKRRDGETDPASGPRSRVDPQSAAAPAKAGVKPRRRRQRSGPTEAVESSAEKAVVEHVTVLKGTTDPAPPASPLPTYGEEPPEPRFKGPVSSVYNRQPRALDEWPYERRAFAEIDGIPIFSRWDAYVDNYGDIAHDHVASLMAAEGNPFMARSLIDDLEDSTRALIARHVKPGSRILDVGVGLGRLLSPFDKLQRYGIDISLDYLRRARETGISCCFSRIEDMPYKDGFFDAVVCTDVLEHVLDLNYCTAQILRVLRPGGVLILRVPHNDLLEVYAEVPQPYELIHLRRFDVPSLRLHFEKIFDCRFVEATKVAPYFKGEPTFKLRALPAHSPVRDLLAGIDDDHPLAFLKPFAQISQERLMEMVGHIWSNHPEIYQQILPHLCEPLEVNAVFVRTAT